MLSTVKLFESIFSILTGVILVNGCNSTVEHGDFFTRGCHTVKTREYNYTEFFPITYQPNHTFWLPFYVKTKEDAHIFLSTTPFIQTTSNHSNPDGYEVVIGAHSNNYTAIRRSRQGVDEKSILGKNEVSPQEWRRFCINVTKSELFSIGRHRISDTFLNWTDSHPATPIKYFSFSSYHGSFGSWAFNCTRQSDLQWDLFIKSKYDRKIAPKNLTRIPLIITSRSIDLDENKNILKLNGTATMTWEDDRLTWKPNDFPEIDHLIIENQFVTWTPNVQLKNVGTYYDEIFGCGHTLIWKNGTITWTPAVNININCIIDTKLWPFDSPICQINITTEAELNFSMNYEVEYSKTALKWKINEIRVIRSITCIETETSNCQYIWSVKITLKRNLSSKHYSLLLALITCSLAWFSSLFITTTWFEAIKIIMNLTLLLMITTISLISIYTIPKFPQQISYLYVAYTTLFVLCALSSCYSVLSLCLCKAQTKINTDLENNNKRINTQDGTTKTEENDQ